MNWATCWPFSRPERTGAGRDTRCRAARTRRVEGLVEGEHVPAGDQDLARDGGLRRVAFPAAALLDLEIKIVPRVVRPRGVLRALDRRPAQRCRARPGEMPVRDFCPD
jgi:hypothetical protein